MTSKCVIRSWGGPNSSSRVSYPKSSAVSGCGSEASASAVRWPRSGGCPPPRLPALPALARHAARDLRHHGVEARLVLARIDELHAVPARAAAGEVALAIEDVAA